MQFKCHSGFVRYIFPNIPNKLEPNRPLFGSCSSRTELLGTCDCSVRNEHEPNRGSVRFCSFRTVTLFGSASNRTNRTNSNLHCSASQLCIPCGSCDLVIFITVPYCLIVFYCLFRFTLAIYSGRDAHLNSS
jgi:hypothetical protein